MPCPESLRDAHGKAKTDSDTDTQMYMCAYRTHTQMHTDILYLRECVPTLAHMHLSLCRLICAHAHCRTETLAGRALVAFPTQIGVDSRAWVA